MSKFRPALGVAAVLGLVAWSSAMGQSIVGTPHDFSGRGWGSTELCIFCHAPHNANATIADAPLWNHAVTTRTFVLYDTPTMDATTTQPAGVSRLCMSCHDGVTAIDAFGTRTGTTVVTGSSNLGTDLGNDHPIGFRYNAALVALDPELRPPPATLPYFGATNDTLECATCHSVHNNLRGNFLRATNVRSALCLQCHIK